MSGKRKMRRAPVKKIKATGYQTSHLSRNLSDDPRYRPLNLAERHALDKAALHYADGEGKFFVKLQDLADRAGVGRSSVVRAMKHGLESGLIVKREQYARPKGSKHGGKQSASIYWFDPMLLVDAEGQPMPRDRVNQEDTTLSLEHRDRVDQESTTLSPDKPSEPSQNDRVDHRDPLDRVDQERHRDRVSQESTTKEKCFREVLSERSSKPFALGAENHTETHMGENQHLEDQDQDLHLRNKLASLEQHRKFRAAKERETQERARLERDPLARALLGWSGHSFSLAATPEGRAQIDQVLEQLRALGATTTGILTRCQVLRNGNIYEPVDLNTLVERWGDLDVEQQERELAEAAEADEAQP